jgi:tetratricopeptide (TPR) repeat protein
VIPDAGAIIRALEPLRLRTPGVLPGQKRELDLDLIVDTSLSMTVWQQTVTSFQTLLTGLGAFAEIRVTSLDTDDPDASLVPLPESASRRLAVVLSDCVGRAWSTGNVLRSLESLAETVPLTIVQMLPQRLWAGCGIHFVPVQVGAHRSEDGAVRLWVGPRPGYPNISGESAPIPMLELDPRWLAPWASLITGETASPIAGMAVHSRSACDAVRPQEVTAPQDRVALFRSVASPTALRLASYLATAPLSLPVLPLLRSMTLPGSRPADLAEVFLSGLLRRVSKSCPEGVDFDFHPGVRQILLASMPRAEVLRVFRSVCQIAGDRFGASLAFNTFFAEGAGTVWSKPDPGLDISVSEPFASIAVTVLRSVGGRYRDIADQLASASGGLSSSELHATPYGGLEPAGADSAAPDSVILAFSGEHAMSDANELAAPTKAPTLWLGVPPHNPNFTGREELLLALRSQLGAGFTTALVPITLYGMGGVGKSQIAIEYIYRFAADYELVCWISGQVPSQLRSGLAALAPHLGIPASADGDQEATLEAVKEALRLGEPYSRWLLVIDNAEQPEEVMRYLPATGGHRLITSRDQAWDEWAQTFHVPQFTRDESIRLIRRRGKNISEEDADSLAERLGDLPLAIEQAAAWQARSGMPVARYLALLEKRMTALLKENTPRGYPLDIVAAWTMAFEHLQDEAPEAAALVQLCSFLGPEPIPYRLLWAFQHARDLPPDLERIFREEEDFYATIRKVGKYALLQVEPSNQTITEHRLVQAVLRERLSEESQAEMVRLVCRLLIAASPGRPDDPSNWDLLSSINQHLSFTAILDQDSPDARRLVIDQARYLFQRGDHASCRELAEKAVRRWRDSPGPDDGQTLQACRLLGIVLRELGRAEEARKLDEDTYQRCVAVFSETHEQTLVMANSYTSDLRMAGNYTDALELDERLYELHKQVFGEDDENTLRSAHNLGIDRRLNGLYADALELNEDTFRRRRGILGDRRWETWSSAGQIARDLRLLGRYEESAQLLTEAIAAMKPLFDSPEHREVIRLRTDYALTLRRLGRLDEAIAEAELCLAVNQRRFGSVHNYTLATMSILAQVLRLLGQADQALNLAERVAVAAPSCYGPGHLLVATAEHNLAVEHRAVGDVETAFAIDRRVNKQFHEAWRDQWRRTTSSDLSLAIDHTLAADLATARDMFAAARGRSEQVRGHGHPRNYFIAMNLSRVMTELGDVAAAEEIRMEVLPALRERLGARHPEVLIAEGGGFIEFEMEIPDR